MYVLALSDYTTCCCRGLKTRPPIKPAPQLGDDSLLKSQLSSANDCFRDILVLIFI